MSSPLASALQLAICLVLFWAVVSLLLSARDRRQRSPPTSFHGSQSRRRAASAASFLPTSSSSPGSRTADSPKSTSFKHSFGHLQLETARLNPLFQAIGLRLTWFWRPWFALGLIAGLAAMAASIAILLGSVLGALNGALSPGSEHSVVEDSRARDFRANSSLVLSTGGTLGRGVGGNGLVSLIPGVNIPLSQLPHYFAALLLAGVVHEFGHAIAAVIYRVPVQSSGIFLSILYPGAFVELHDPSLALLAPIHRLHIICAGVHHNLVLGILSFGILYALPTLLSPAYQTLDNGVVILDVMDESPLVGHVARGQVVESVNLNAVAGIRAWENVLWKTANDVSIAGWCIPPDVRNAYPFNCCDVTLSQPLGPPDVPTQCFRLSTLTFNATQPADPKTHSCLPMREVVEQAPRCSADADCADDGAGGAVGYSCLVPHIGHPDIRVLRLDVDGRAVTFLGDPREVWEGLKVGSLQPRGGLVPLALPYMIERFLQFTISLTFALTIFNMVPAFHLDGYHALLALADWASPLTASQSSHSSKARRKQGVIKAVDWTARVGLAAVMVKGIYAAIVAS
ncbi:peptidase family M50-domain-containing protein [Geranomyces variabilis]|nr:peptidase family M50-domain-containing protein [Geranomyces variabilis]KAJ3135715.1 Membrane-bound transcription factor site-2 protease [Geranomyces variabilis]